MKKIFTLLFAVGMLTVVAHAQPGQRDNRPFDERNDQRHDQQFDPGSDQQFNEMDFERGYDKRRFIIETNDYFDRGGRYNDRFFMERKRDMMIDRINREYDYKIQRVRRDFFLTWYEKQRKIRFLENQRRWEISKVIERCNGYSNYWRHNRHHDRDDRSYRRY